MRDPVEDPMNRKSGVGRTQEPFFLVLWHCQKNSISPTNSSFFKLQHIINFGHLDIRLMDGRQHQQGSINLVSYQT